MIASAPDGWTRGGAWWLQRGRWHISKALVHGVPTYTLWDSAGPRPRQHSSGTVAELVELAEQWEAHEDAMQWVDDAGDEPRKPDASTA